MIKLTIFPGRIRSITNQSWDYLKAIGDHITSEGKECVSLTEYAIKLNNLSMNIEIERVFSIQYFDGVIKLYLNTDWAKRHKEQPYAVAQLEYDNKTY